MDDFLAGTVTIMVEAWNVTSLWQNGVLDRNNLPHRCDITTIEICTEPFILNTVLFAVCLYEYFKERIITNL